MNSRAWTIFYSWSILGLAAGTVLTIWTGELGLFSICLGCGMAVGLLVGLYDEKARKAPRRKERMFP